MEKHKKKEIFLFFLGLSLIPFVFFGAESFSSVGTEELPVRLSAFKVEVIREVWLDESRGREVPVKIYYPADLKNRAPAIIFSHGLGGSREGYEYLGRFWAENGLISIHLQHAGSDEAVWKGKKQPLAEMRKAAANPANALERVKDVSFTLDRLAKINNQPGPLKGLINLQKIGLAGHSFGAHTTLLIAGQQMILPGGRELSFADKRVRAVIPMSDSHERPSAFK